MHFFIQSKLETYQPILMAGFLMWLMAYRGLVRRNGEVSPLHLLLLAFAAAGATAAGEALLYMLTSGVDARLVLLAHLDIEMELRPAGWVLASGLAVAAAGLWRYRPVRPRPSSERMVSEALSGVTQVQSGS